MGRPCVFLLLILDNSDRALQSNHSKNMPGDTASPSFVVIFRDKWDGLGFTIVMTGWFCIWGFLRFCSVSTAQIFIFLLILLVSTYGCSVLPSVLQGSKAQNVLRLLCIFENSVFFFFFFWILGHCFSLVPWKSIDFLLSRFLSSCLFQSSLEEDFFFLICGK